MRLLLIIVSMLVLSPAYTHGATREAFPQQPTREASVQQASREANVGLLDCKIGGGWGFIFGSRKKLDCVFERKDNGSKENYIGVIRKAGFDIGWTWGSKVSWELFAPSNAIQEAGRLAGTYRGASAEVTVVAGLGVNVGFVSSDKIFKLRPKRIQAQTGVNISFADSRLILKVKE